MASKLLKKFKDSMKFSIAPQKFIKDEADKSDLNSKQVFVNYVQRAQKFDPGSHIGFSGVPGVKSQQGLKAQRKEADTEVALQAAAGQASAQAAGVQEDTAQAEARRAQSAQLELRRRAKRFAYGYDRAGGGMKLGGESSAGGGQKTLLGY